MICCKNCNINFSVWKADDEIKVQKNNIHIKNFGLWVTYHESFTFFVNFISFDIVYCQ